MADIRIDTYAPQLQIAPARQPQVAQPKTSFGKVLAGGGNVLLAGASLTAGVIGGPALAMAVTAAAGGVAGGSGGLAAGRAALGPSSNGAAAPATANAHADSGGDIAAMRAMNLESFQNNSQLMRLQEEVQQENRRFTTLSNVLRARHDTAKAAVSNIRS